jgi:hypothetical protein
MDEDRHQHEGVQRQVVELKAVSSSVKDDTGGVSPAKA